MCERPNAGVPKGLLVVAYIFINCLLSLHMYLMRRKHHNAKHASPDIKLQCAITAEMEEGCGPCRRSL